MAASAQQSESWQGSGMPACQLLLVFALLMTWRGTARAQTVQLWPEVDLTFIKMTDSTRLYLLATTVNKDSETTSGEFGPNLDIYLQSDWQEEVLGGVSAR